MSARAVAASPAGGLPLDAAELALRLLGELGLAGKKAARLDPRVERESWRLLASLERLDAGTRVRVGDAFVARLRQNPDNASLLWSVGRLGARAPLTVRSAASCRRRTRRDGSKPSSRANERPGPRGRHRADRRTHRRSAARGGRERARPCRVRLREAGVAAEAMHALDEVIATTMADANRVFGEPATRRLAAGCVYRREDSAEPDQLPCRRHSSAVTSRGSRALRTVLDWTPRRAYTSDCGEAISR